MPTVNLGPTPGTEPAVVVPGRVRMELARLVALAQAGSVRLPFDVTAVEAALATDATGTAADEARRAWYARLSSETPSPEDALAGLLAQQVGRVHAAAADEPGPDAEAARAAQQEALAVLGRPEALLEVELGLRLGPGAPEQVRAWVAVRGQAAVSLGTVSGADFELSWGAVAALPEMLAHLVRLPEAPYDEDAGPVADLPPRFTLPVELMAAVDASAQRHREELLPALVERFPLATTGADGEAYDAAATQGLLNAVHDRLTARLRVLVPGVQDDGARLSGAGVVVWMRVGEQWFALDPDLVAGIPVARATAVEPRDLARWVGPVIARVRGKEGDGDG
ncbi:hypothetical protein [Nocardioides sp. LML1-1-1.1]|uniref:hypothetical protein n=1 Tax=Nocardioides sp. LML1-1-1.1 TaxID=3135248 RepID=UPI00343CA0D4